MSVTPKQENTTPNSIRGETTVDMVDTMYKAAWQLAGKTNNSAAMVSAVTGLTKLHGLNTTGKSKQDGLGSVVDGMVGMLFAPKLMHAESETCFIQHDGDE